MQALLWDCTRAEHQFPDCDGFDIVHKKLSSSKEPFMIVPSRIGSLCQSEEPISVELAKEECYFGQIESNMEDLALKLPRVVHHEASFVRLPRDNVYILVLFRKRKHRMQLHWEIVVIAIRIHILLRKIVGMIMIVVTNNGMLLVLLCGYRRLESGKREAHFCLPSCNFVTMSASSVGSGSYTNLLHKYVFIAFSSIHHANWYDSSRSAYTKHDLNSSLSLNFDCGIMFHVTSWQACSLESSGSVMSTRGKPTTSE